MSARVLATLFLFSVAANHAFALLLARHVSTEAFSSSEEFFHFQMDQRKLLRMSHQHAFGHGIMYLALGVLVCLTGLPEAAKLSLLCLPFLGAGLDLASWWLIKFRGGGWEWLSYAGGALLSLGAAASILAVLWEAWFARLPGEQGVPH